MRHAPNFENNLISLRMLEAKGCSFKSSDGSLKVIKGSMVLMRGRRNERNLYKPIVGGGCLRHKINEIVCG